MLSHAQHQAIKLVTGAQSRLCIPSAFLLLSRDAGHSQAFSLRDPCTLPAQPSTPGNIDLLDRSAPIPCKLSEVHLQLPRERCRSG